VKDNTSHTYGASQAKSSGVIGGGRGNPTLTSRGSRAKSSCYCRYSGVRAVGRGLKDSSRLTYWGSQANSSGFRRVRGGDEE
jgi:hypothetical protein